MTASIERMNELFEELVPGTGKSDSLAGEMCRAAARIGYRYFNDGDLIGIGYGKETCNAPARFLGKFGDDKVTDIISNMWGLENEALYEDLIDQMCDAIVDLITQIPKLKETPTVDMWDLFDKYEDYDDTDEEDEDEWY